MKTGWVIKSTGSWYSVREDTGITYECVIKGKLRMKDLKTTNPVAVGDWVDFDYLEKESANQHKQIGVIKTVHERKNYIIRRSQNLSKQAHIIAANIDQAILVVTINYPVTTTTFIDRYLASAEAYRIPVVIVFNKTDRYNSEQTRKMVKWAEVYQNIGYQTLQISAKSDHDIRHLSSVMAGKLNVLNGHSGVGKSTLINRISPGLNLKTREISNYHETGKHTTTFSELYELFPGCFVIDTPGIKAFGMLEMDAWEISHYFPEIFKISHDCQYGNCSHTHEPDCAVKNAVVNGIVAESRYLSYLGLLDKDQKHRAAY